jgi:hypothetical protein
MRPKPWEEVTMKKQAQKLRVSRETLANLSRIGLKGAAGGHYSNAVSCVTQCPIYCLVESEGCT